MKIQIKTIGILALIIFLGACQLNAPYRSGAYRMPPASQVERAPEAQVDPNAPKDAETVDKSVIYHPVNIAIMLPLSGPHEELGRSMLNAAQLGVFDVAHDDFNLIPYVFSPTVW